MTIIASCRARDKWQFLALRAQSVFNLEMKNEFSSRLMILILVCWNLHSSTLQLPICHDGDFTISQWKEKKWESHREIYCHLIFL